MSNCQQTSTQNVLEHGLSVKSYLFDFLDHLRKGTPLKYNWKLPEWIESISPFLETLPDDETLELYTTYHDCGKPYCLEIDSEGKRHFPNHSQKSYEIFNQVFDNPIAGDLILHDMDIHTLKSEGVSEFCRITNCITLLLTGLAELHSNCQMFGGVESTSFKIKFKSISQRGKQIINTLNSNQS